MAKTTLIKGNPNVYRTTRGGIPGEMYYDTFYPDPGYMSAKDKKRFKAKGVEATQKQYGIRGQGGVYYPSGQRLTNEMARMGMTAYQAKHGAIGETFAGGYGNPTNEQVNAQAAKEAKQYDMEHGILDKVDSGSSVKSKGSLAKGGHIKSTGHYKLHKGETVLTAAQTKSLRKVLAAAPTKPAAKKRAGKKKPGPKKKKY